MGQKDSVSRRSLLKLSAAIAAPLVVAACESAGSPQGKSKNELVKKASGSTLRLGVGGAATTDRLDPATYTDTFVINVGRQIMNGLIEYDEKGRPIPELLESWEARPGAAQWSFRVRRGVVFHNGKTLDAADIAYSLNRHRANNKSPGARALRDVSDIRAVGGDLVEISLRQGTADLLHVLADFPYLVVPDGFTDWSRPIGTGPFKFESFEPGVGATAVRQDNYWKNGHGRVEAVETIAVNNAADRVAGVMNGSFDAVNRVPTADVSRIRSHADLSIMRSPGRYHPLLGMQTDTSPFDSIHVRRALKHGIDRQTVLESLFGGFGSLGNDHPIAACDPDYNLELPQTVYDPDLARHHLKQAGLDKLDIDLYASDAAFVGAVDLAHQLSSTASTAGIDVRVSAVPTARFWDGVWMKRPFVIGYWGGRPSAIQMMEVAYWSRAGWNETHWRDAEFDALLERAKTELDQERRRQYLWQLQAILHDAGGAIIPAFRDWLDAVNARVKGYVPHTVFDLCDGRFAEKVWIEA